MQCFRSSGHDQRIVNPLKWCRQLVRNVTQATSDSLSGITENATTLSRVTNNNSKKQQFVTLKAQLIIEHFITVVLLWPVITDPSS